MGISSTFLTDRVAALQAQIIAYDDAIQALITTPVLSYTLDTGQDRQVVTRLNLAELQRTRNSLWNLLDVLCVRLTGQGSITVRPLV